jgi:hypothetical protein
LVPLPAWWRHQFWNTQALLELAGEQTAERCRRLRQPAAGGFDLPGSSPRGQARLFLAVSVVLCLATALFFPLTSSLPGVLFIAFLRRLWIAALPLPGSRASSDFAVARPGGWRVSLHCSETCASLRGSTVVPALAAKIPRDGAIVSDYTSLESVSAYLDVRSFRFSRGRPSGSRRTIAASIRTGRTAMDWNSFSAAPARAKSSCSPRCRSTIAGVRRVFYRPFSGHVVGERRSAIVPGNDITSTDQSAPAPAYRWTLGRPISGDAMKVFLRRARRPATRGRPCGGGRQGADAILDRAERGEQTGDARERRAEAEGGGRGRGCGSRRAEAAPARGRSRRRRSTSSRTGCPRRRRRPRGGSGAGRRGAGLGHEQRHLERADPRQHDRQQASPASERPLEQQRSGASDGSQFSGAKFENTPSTACPRDGQPAAISSTSPRRNSIEGAPAPFPPPRPSRGGLDHRRRRIAGDHPVATPGSVRASSPVPQPISSTWQVPGSAVDGAKHAVAHHRDQGFAAAE